MGEVVELNANLAIAEDKEAIADRLDRLAEQIRTGEFENVTRVFVLIERDDKPIIFRPYGRRCSVAEAVGAMTIMAQAIGAGAGTSDIDE